MGVLVGEESFQELEVGRQEGVEVEALYVEGMEQHDVLQRASSQRQNHQEERTQGQIGCWGRVCVGGGVTHTGGSGARGSGG